MICCGKKPLGSAYKRRRSDSMVKEYRKRSILVRNTEKSLRSRSLLNNKRGKAISQKLAYTKTWRVDRSGEEDATK